MTETCCPAFSARRMNGPIFKYRTQVLCPYIKVSILVQQAARVIRTPPPPIDKSAHACLQSITKLKANLKEESLTKFDGDCVGVANGNNEGFLFVI